MWNDQPAFPVPQILGSSGPQESPNRGILQGMEANPHNAPLTHTELVEMAIRTADVLIPRL